MMVRLRNVSSGLVMVGERYLFPAEARLVDEATAAAAERGNVGALERWNEAAPIPDDKPLLSAQETADGGRQTAGDDLTVIRGIGNRVAEALGTLGITSLGDLAGWDAAVLAKALDGSSQAQVEKWIVRAQDLLAEES
jgi:predicted flap endonuclease-1-like 5' DNA nuclease